MKSVEIITPLLWDNTTIIHTTFCAFQPFIKQPLGTMVIRSFNWSFDHCFSPFSMSSILFWQLLASFYFSLLLKLTKIELDKSGQDINIFTHVSRFSLVISQNYLFAPDDSSLHLYCSLSRMNQLPTNIFFRPVRGKKT